MENYVGKICPFCRTELKEEDTIKVCPACNTPHHEACWEVNNGCTTFGCSEQHYEAPSTTSANVCQNCGTALKDGQNFCPKCGTQKTESKKNVCGKCGTELQEGQAFCPKCGQKADVAVDASLNSAINQFNAGVEKKKKKKALLPIILGGVAVVIVALILILKGPAVEEIVLSKSFVEIKAGDSTSVSYTIAPDKASDVEVTWKSSNESVATVNSNGKIIGKGEGSCTITATAGKKSDSMTVTVKDGPDLKAIYNKFDSPYYCTLASDGSYLTVDTNVFDIDDYFDSDAYYGLSDIIVEIGLPDSLLAEMGETRALDGRQTAEYDDVSVSWSYHPDSGLEVMFKVK